MRCRFWKEPIWLQSTRRSGFLATGSPGKYGAGQIFEAEVQGSPRRLCQDPSGGRASQHRCQRGRGPTVRLDAQGQGWTRGESHSRLWLSTFPLRVLTFKNPHDPSVISWAPTRSSDTVKEIVLLTLAPLPYDLARTHTASVLHPQELQTTSSETSRDQSWFTFTPHHSWPGLCDRCRGGAHAAARWPLQTGAG